MNDTGYAGAAWVKANRWCKGMSPLGEKVADLLGDLFLGIYHLTSTHLQKVEWDNPLWIEVTLDKQMATHDFDELTRLVVFCHDRGLRCQIAPANFRCLRLMFHDRGTGRFPHPSLDEALARIRRHYAPQETAHAG